MLTPVLQRSSIFFVGSDLRLEIQVKSYLYIWHEIVNYSTKIQKKKQTKRESLSTMTSSRAAPVILNVYDLSPDNVNYYSFGLGFYHSGLEVYGVEYSYGTDGAFRHEPKQAYGVVFRESIPLGHTDKSSSDISKLANEIAEEFKKKGGYNVLQRNCNHFTRALAEKIVPGCSFPGWVNRMAGIGNTFSWLLPKSAFENQPVPNGPDSVTNVGASKVAAKEQKSFSAFSGTGKTLGTSPSKPPANSKGMFGWWGSENKDSSKEVKQSNKPATVSKMDRQKILEATEMRLQQKNSSV
jgi:hypothetical protein